MKREKFYYQYKGHRVVLISDEVADKVGLTPVVKETTCNPYIVTPDVVQLIESGDVDCSLCYDDAYSEYCGENEIVLASVKNFENDQDTIEEWITREFWEMVKEDR